jgi:histo-blood group ABO system transferase
MKICILNIATNNYIQFVNPLLESIDNNFLNGHEISSLLFTNHDLDVECDRIRASKIEHESWPMPTLKRYHYFVQEKEYISQFDYCYYLDVDTRIESKVGDEILGDLVATQHPGFWFKNSDSYTYERRPESTAYIPYGEGKMYYAGGFNGGKTENFLRMTEAIVDNVNTDFSNGIIAEWHDESHLNRYLLDTPPTVELTPSYCYPEAVRFNSIGWNVPFEPKIVALEKNHKEVRS